MQAPLILLRSLQLQGSLNFNWPIKFMRADTIMRCFHWGTSNFNSLIMHVETRLSAISMSKLITWLGIIGEQLSSNYLLFRLYIIVPAWDANLPTTAIPGTAIVPQPHASIYLCRPWEQPLIIPWLHRKLHLTFLNLSARFGDWCKRLD